MNGVIDHLLGQVHHCDIDLVQASGPVVCGDLGDRLAKPFCQHPAVGQAAVTRPEPPGGGQVASS